MQTLLRVGTKTIELLAIKCIKEYYNIKKKDILKYVFICIIYLL